MGGTTVDATLRLVKVFFHWLVSQTGFKRVLTYADVEYFNNTRKAGRVAHTQRQIPYPSMQQAAHAFQAMPFETEFHKRDKALFAFFMLTGARDGAVASLKLKHVNVEMGHVFQDAREVNTKAAKTIHCQFLPVDQAYHDCFTEWMTFLREVKLFGPEDALFPKPLMNPDLHMANDLKATGAGNLFVIFGEPDIRITDAGDGMVTVQVFGVDVFKPQTGEVQSEGTDGIALWMLDTDYNEESFFVRHAYFLGANDPYKALKTTLKAEIDEEAWESLYSDTSRPFAKPKSGRIAVKVINHLGDEVMKVFAVE